MTLAARGQIGEGGLARGWAPITSGTIAEQWAALFTSAGHAAPFSYGLDPDAVAVDGSDQPALSFSGGAISAWANEGEDTGNSATQGTAAARPTYDATGLNSKPAIYCDRTALLLSSAFDASAYTWCCITTLYSRVASPSAPNAGYIPAEFGNGATPSIGSMTLLGNPATGLKDAILSQIRNDQPTSARTDTLYDMVTPAMVSATGDFTLGADEAEIRVGGANATFLQSGSGSVGTFGNNACAIGARELGNLGHEGWISFVGIAFGTGSVPVAVVAAGESLVGTAWGI